MTSAVESGEISLTLPDGSVRKVSAGSTGADLAQAISPRLAKAALAVMVNDQLTEIGPEKLGGKWYWNYVAVPSSLCDLCEDRIEAGLKEGLSQENAKPNGTLIRDGAPKGVCLSHRNAAAFVEWARERPKP